MRLLQSLCVSRGGKKKMPGEPIALLSSVQSLIFRCVYLGNVLINQLVHCRQLLWCQYPYFYIYCLSQSINPNNLCLQVLNFFFLYVLLLIHLGKSERSDRTEREGGKGWQKLRSVRNYSTCPQPHGNENHKLINIWNLMSMFLFKKIIIFLNNSKAHIGDL